MSAKVYGYAETKADVDALRAYAAKDIILKDMADHGQYQILRRFLREGDTLIVAHWSALGDSALSIILSAGKTVSPELGVGIVFLW